MTSSSTQMWARALTYTKEASDTMLPCMLDELARIYGYRIALIDDNAVIDYVQLAYRVNRVARWALFYGFGHDTIVCLLMCNQIDYAVLWLALTRIGCTVALINTNLRSDAIQHCINTAKAQEVITSGIQMDITAKRVWDWDTIKLTDPTGLLNDGLPSAERILDGHRPWLDKTALLIYTSGTTGLPKATIITHRRVTQWSYWFAGMMDVQQTDRLYNCLPMYHSVGGVVAIGAMLVKGGSVFIREKFSASRFWDEVVNRHCTIFQYIGELCRYLTLSPSEHPFEKSHHLRLACGNGLQGDVWTKFQERFAIPQILEFYAATEGALSLYNCEGKPGAIGRIPPYLGQHSAVALIRYDPETGEPVRSEDGFCVRAAIDEPGEAISRLSRDRPFDGYTDHEASQHKVLHSVFAKGDAWFRSGDLMQRDEAGYFYFLDRLGDTFRWKGENVSTTEVTSVLRGCPGVLDAVVYGVAVPGSEGRAGMAAIVPHEGFDLATLADHLEQHLPEYARPVYLRMCAALATTQTHKLIRTDLMRDGYACGSDPIYVLDRGTYKYLNETSDSPSPVG